MAISPAEVDTRALIPINLPAERYELLGTIILQLQELPLARDRTLMYFSGSVSPQSLDSPECRALFQRLEAAKNADVRAAAVEMKAKLEADLKSKPAPFTTDYNKPTVDPKLVRLDAVKLAANDPEASKLRGLVSCGAGLDVLWSEHAVFLMKEKGKLAVAWRTKDLNLRITTVCFDGRFVWVATGSPRQSVPVGRRRHRTGPGLRCRVAPAILDRPRFPTFLAFQGERAHIIQELTGEVNSSVKNPRPLHSSYVPVTFQWYIVEPGETRPRLAGIDLPIVRAVACSLAARQRARCVPRG